MTGDGADSLNETECEDEYAVPVHELLPIYRDLRECEDMALDQGDTKCSSTLASFADDLEELIEDAQ